MDQFSSQPPILQALVLNGLGFMTALVLVTLARLVNGASPGTLLRDRLFEIPPMRGMLWTVWLMFWAALLIACALLVQSCYRMTQYGFGATLVTNAVICCAAAISAYVLQRVWRQRVLDVSGLRPPNIPIGLAEVERRIPRDEFLSLGAERFPNVIHPNWKTDLAIRRLTAILAFIAIAGIAFVWYDCVQHATRVDWLRAIESIATPAKTIPPGIGIFLLSASGILLLCVLWSNFDYGLIKFRRALTLSITLACVVLFGAASAGAAPAALWAIVAMAAGLLGWRALRDLRLARQYRRVKSVRDAILTDLRPTLGYLSSLPEDAAFALQPLDANELSERITRGSKNVEERGVFVTRHMGRFMRLAHVFHEPFAAAVLRFLTVRRYVTLDGGISTYEMLNWPEVPQWNLNLFPLRSPSGYVNWLDPLLLDASWDVVKACHQCGGSGRVWVTESYSETEYYTEYYTDAGGRSASRAASRTVTKTRQVQKTCPSCLGSGRLKHSQILNTQWQRLIVSEVSPALPMPELTEDAEEVVHYQTALTEDLMSQPRQPKCAIASDHPLVAEIARSVEGVTALHETHTALVEQLHDGRIFRSDFRICGFHVVKIGFERLRGRAGWFFGCRPEFHFPNLPISWSMVATITFGPPLLLALAGAVAMFAAILLDR